MIQGIIETMVAIATDAKMPDTPNFTNPMMNIIFDKHANSIWMTVNSVERNAINTLVRIAIIELEQTSIINNSARE